MQRAIEGQRGLRLLGTRRRRAESRSNTGRTGGNALPKVLKKSRSLFDIGVYDRAEPAKLSDNVSRLLLAGADARRDLLQAFYAFLREHVPGFQFEAIGIVKQTAVDYVIEHLADRASEALGGGGGGIMCLRANYMETLENTLIFRGDVDGKPFDVLVNRIKVKGLLRYLEKPPIRAGEVRQTLVLINPRVLSQRLIVTAAIVVAHD